MQPESSFLCSAKESAREKHITVKMWHVIKILFFSRAPYFNDVSAHVFRTYYDQPSVYTERRRKV